VISEEFTQWLIVGKVQEQIIVPEYSTRSVEHPIKDYPLGPEPYHHPNTSTKPIKVIGKALRPLYQPTVLASTR